MTWLEIGALVLVGCLFFQTVALLALAKRMIRLGDIILAISKETHPEAAKQSTSRPRDT